MQHDEYDNNLLGVSVRAKSVPLIFTLSFLDELGKKEGIVVGKCKFLYFISLQRKTCLRNFPLSIYS